MKILFRIFSVLFVLLLHSCTFIPISNNTTVPEEPAIIFQNDENISVGIGAITDPEEQKRIFGVKLTEKEKVIPVFISIKNNSMDDCFFISRDRIKITRKHILDSILQEINSETYEANKELLQKTQEDAEALLAKANSVRKTIRLITAKYPFSITRNDLLFAKIMGPEILIIGSIIAYHQIQGYTDAQVTHHNMVIHDFCDKEVPPGSQVHGFIYLRKEKMSNDCLVSIIVEKKHDTILEPYKNYLFAL